MRKKRGKKILAVFLSMLMVIGVMPTDWTAGIMAEAATTTLTAGNTIAGGTYDGWNYSVFGNSTGSTAGINNTAAYDDSTKTLTLNSTGGKGKIATSNEGINYVYYKLSKDQDFIIKTHAKLTTWSLTTQIGFGLMVRAAVNASNTTTEASPLNSAFVGGMVQSVGGVSTLFKGSYRPDTTIGTWTKLGQATDSSIYANNTELDLCIQKVGDNLHLWNNGDLIATESVANVITGNDMYVGLFTSRTCTVDYSNTTFSYMNASDNSNITVGSVTNPTKTQYINGNSYKDIDLTGFSANVTVAGVAKTITAADCRIKNYDFTKDTDSGAIILDYYGKEISIPITVITEKVTDIEINYLPVKTDYFVNDTIDWTGFDATVTYNSGVTKKLQNLIAAKDSETVVTYDFSKSGKATVAVSHTHGGVTKEVSFDVKVSGASVSSIQVSGPNQTTFYKGVTVDANAYKEGLLVTATYSDNSTKVLTDGFAVTPKTDALNTAQTGDYTYVVSYGGKTQEYTLHVIDRTVTGLEIASYPTTTTFVKGTDFSAAGLAVEAVYDSGEKTPLATSDYTIDASSYKKDTAGEYSIKISATVDGKALSTTFVAAVRDKVDFTYNDLTWNSIVFGQSCDGTNEPTVKDGVITVEQGEGKGKCTDDGQDGIAYYYTVLNPKADNFEISAKVTVDYFITKSAPDNQEGFGIMVRDSIGTDKDSSIYYSNAMSVGGYYGAFNVFGRYGIASATDGSGKVNYTLNAKGLSDRVLSTAPKTFNLTLKKDNTGIYATMLDDKGNPVNGIDGKSTVYLPSSTFSSIDDSKMYVGFMAARGAKIEVNTSDISMKVTDKNADSPQTYAAPVAVTPSVSASSLLQTADESYNFGVTVNTKGLLTIKQNGETLKSQQVVTAGTYSFPTTLLMGDNQFQMYFEPDSTQNITSATPVTANTTVVRKLYATVADPIYVSTTGTSSGAGTKDSPLDIQTALTYCQPGQAIYVLQGTYSLTQTTGVWEGNNGSEKLPKQLVACPANTGDVVFDFASKTGAATSYTFDFSGDYWYVNGITIQNGGGVRVGGNHNILKNCSFIGHTNSGLQISRTNSATDQKDWPSYNQIINCNAFSNRDPSDNNADGFGAKLTCGVGNVFKGCVSAYNADDGWDLFSKGSSGAIGAVKIYDCVCYANGYAYDATTKTITATKGDGNGFKLGGSGIAVNHEIYNSYSFGNKSNGFTNNSDPMGTYVNCTAYDNGKSNFDLHIYTGATAQFKVSGFKSYADDLYKNITGLDATDTDGESDCLSLCASNSNYFYNASTGLSTNAAGKKLESSNFVSLSEFAAYIERSIEVKRSAEGVVDLGNFLKYRPDTTALDSAKADAEKLLEASSGYTDASVKTLSDTLATVKALDIYTLTQDQVDGYVAALQKAIAGLAKKPANPGNNTNPGGTETNPTTTGSSTGNTNEVISPVQDNNAIVGAQLESGAVVKDAAGNVIPASDIRIKLTPVSTPTITQAVQQALTSKEIAISNGTTINYYEISLIDSTGAKVTLESGKVLVTFSYPAGTNSSDFEFSVYHLNDSGVLELLAPTLSADGITVETTGFSPYAVVATPKTTASVASTVSVATGDSAHTSLFIILGGIAALVVIAAAGYEIMRRKKKAQSSNK